MPNGTVYVQGPDGKHYAFGPQSGVVDEATARAYFQKNGIGAPRPSPTDGLDYSTKTPEAQRSWIGRLLSPENIARSSEPPPNAPWYSPDRIAAAAVRTVTTPISLLRGPTTPEEAGTQFSGGYPALVAQRLFAPTQDMAAKASAAKQQMYQALDSGAPPAEANKAFLKMMGYGAAAGVPVIGPGIASSVERAGKGDVLGAVAEPVMGAELYGAGKIGEKPAVAGDPFANLPRAEALVKAREIIHDGLTRQVMQPAQTELGTALAKARVPEVDTTHPLYDIANAKTGKQFVEALRNEETAGILDRSLRDLSKTGDLDPQFRSKWLAASKKPFDFVTAAKPGRNARGVFSSIMSQPGWAMVGMELGGLAGKALGIPFVGRALGASKLAEIGTTREGMGLARDMLSKMPPETERAAPAVTPAAPAVDPAAARANALMRARNPEMFGQPAMAPDQRAARIAQILQEAKGAEGGLSERRTASSPAPATPAPTTPTPTVNADELVSVGRNLGMRPEEAQARAQEAITQFPNDQNAAIQYMAGRKAPVATQAVQPVSGGATPQLDPVVRARQMQVAGEGMPMRPATPAEQAWTDAMANFGNPERAQAPAGIVNNPEFTSQRQRSNLAKNQRQMVGTTSGAAQDTAFFQQAKAELGPNASDSQVVLRAQQLKVDALRALRAKKK